MNEETRINYEVKTILADLIRHDSEEGNKNMYVKYFYPAEGHIVEEVSNRLKELLCYANVDVQWQYIEEMAETICLRIKINTIK